MSMQGWSKNAPDSKDWSFGQITPIILLLAPLLSVIELIAGKWKFERLQTVLI